MGRENLVTAVNDLTEAVRLLEYHLSNEASTTVLFLHYRLVKHTMKALDAAMDAGLSRQKGK